MTPTLTSLLGFAAWTILLAFCTLGYRTSVVLAGTRRANAWRRGSSPEGEPDLMIRVRDAHMNCAENLPVFAAIAAVAVATEQLGAIDAVAPYVLAARLGQSTTHLLGTSHWHVFVRASFYGLQLALYAYMIAQLF